jgi:hypothetical protein
MTDSYVTSKIKEALKVTHDDVGDAVKLLVTWAVRDQSLLLGFTKTTLKEIVQERVAQQVKAGKKSDTSQNRSSGAIVFPQKGDKRTTVAVPPPKTSKHQETVMQQIVAAFKKK